MRGPSRPTPADLGVQRVDWAELGPAFLTDWGRPGGKIEPEHLTVYGKSGGGKSHFVTAVLKERNRLRGSHVVAVVTKRSDALFSQFGWPIHDSWPPAYGEDCTIFWARAKGISAEHRAPQRAKVKELMDKLWRGQSNIIVYWDELNYIEKMLRLGPEIETYYREGRANGITIVSSMQRPTGVSRLAHSESGWTVAFPPKDVDDRDRVAEVLGDRTRFRLVLDDLNRMEYEFLIRHDRSGESYISKLPPPAPTRVRSRR